MTRLLRRSIALLLCLLMPLSYCTAENVGDLLVVGMLSTRTFELRPLTPQERDIVSVYGVVYESLVAVDDNGLPQPYLAETWSETGGGKTWTFTLRDDVRFSDGTPLTAGDVAASGQYILDLAKNEEVEDHGFYANIRYMVSSFKALDDRTVQVKAERDYYGLLYAMTFPVVPASQVEMANPLGSGPYVITAFDPLNYLMLGANPNWWQTQPQVKEISVKFYSNNKEMINAYEYGRVDTVFTRSVSAAQYKSGISSLSIAYSTRQLEVLMLSHRERSFPLDDQRVRLAIRYAIDRDRISQNVYMGMTTRADTPIPSDSWLYYDEASRFTYDPDRARALLAEAGWTDLDGNGTLDFPVEGAEKPKHLVLGLWVYEDPQNDVRFETANMIADMLKEVGISVHIETVSYDECKEVLESGRFDMALCSFQMDVAPDVGFFLRKGNKQNYARYNSSEMTSLIDALRKQETQSEFAYTSQAIQQLFAADVPFICLFYRTGAVLTRKMYTTVRTLREFELLRGIEAFGR